MAGDRRVPVPQLPGPEMNRSRAEELLGSQSLGWKLRVVGVILVYACTIYAFASGVETTQLADFPHRPLLSWIYYASSLFVLGGTDIGTPSGGPPLARDALWFAFFAAPLITTTALAETLLSLLKSRAPKPPELNDHVIVIGTDPLSHAYLDAVRAANPTRPVLLLEHVEDDAPGAVGAPDERLVSRLRGNAARPETLQVAGVARAHCAVAITAADLVNLECAWALHAANPQLPVAANVADLTLLRPVNRLVREQRTRAGEGRSPVVFSTHRIAALYLFENSLQPHFQGTGYRDRVVIAGFGRLGQTLLELLAALAAEDLAQVVIVDPDASRRFRQFTADVDLGELEIELVDGVLEDPATWDAVSAKVRASEGPPLFVLSDVNVLSNFRAAMLLRGRSPETRVFVRCFERSSFTDNLAEQLSVELLSVENVLHGALKDHYEALASA